MGDFRIPFGRALGRQNNFFARTDGLAAVGDTTPDVTDIGLLYTSNTSNTSITYFDLRTPQGNNTQPGWFEGKELRVIFLDDSTTLVRSAQLVLDGGNSTFGQNGVIDLIFHNSSWIEVHRSENQGAVTANSAGLGTTGIVNVAGVKTLLLTTFSGSSAILRRALKGDNGDVINVLNIGGSDSLIIVNSAANDTFVSTTSGSSTQITLASSAGISFVKNGNFWFELRDVIA